MKTITQRKPIPKRFQVARPTLVLDRFMFHFIKLGGLGIILAVFGIFVFILFQIWPLFGGARVEERETLPLGEEREFVAMGTDEWSELPFFVEANGALSFLDTVDVGGEDNRGFFPSPTPLPELDNGSTYSFLRYNERGGDLLAGTSDGQFSIVDIAYQATFPPGQPRIVIPTVTPTPLLPIGPDGVAVERLAYGDSGPRKIAAAIQSVDGQRTLHAVTLVQPRTLFGVGEVTVDKAFDLTYLLATEPADLLVSWEADSLLVAGADGTLSYLYVERDGFSLRQVFRPFDDLEDPRIASMDFLLGDVSVVFTSPTGENRTFSLYRDAEHGDRIWGETKTFPALPQGAEFFSSGLRNKAFLLGSEGFASLRYSTTENIRWEEELPFSIAHAAIAPRYNRLLFVDTDNNLRFYDLDDPHPSAGWRTYFGKIQYEGQAEATYTS
ncbi:MAG: hypothetical protein WD490_07460, partial [Opitutales bacterium]